MIGSVLALTMALPSYVGCRFEHRHQLLAPFAGEVAPTNTAIWYLESVNVPDPGGRPALIDLETGRPIDAIERTTPLRSGLLVELRPTAELSPAHRYAIAIPSFDPIEFTTDLLADRIRPVMPEARESEEAGALAHCLRSASIAVHTKTSEPDIFTLATTPEDGDLAIARGEELLVPASSGEQLTLSIVAMDLAGNRSPGTLPIQASAGGCRTVRPSDGLLLALLPMILLAKRRRR